MRGFARSFGAVSIINAISIGKGAALGIDLATEAYVRITESPEIRFHGELDDSLVREVVSSIFSRLDAVGLGCEVRTSSNIPVAVGLKSSSSAAVATSLAVLDALGATLPLEEVLRLVADASQRSGTSITGALDDAAACMLGGIVITDNLERRVLKRLEAPNDVGVAILVPPRRQFTRDLKKETLEPISGLVEEAYKLATEGSHWKALTINGILHAAALSYPLEPIIEALRNGAIAAGISGTGPAVAAVAPHDKLDEVKAVFERYEGRVLTCSVNNKRAVVGREVRPVSV